MSIEKNVIPRPIDMTDNRKGVTAKRFQAPEHVKASTRKIV